MKTRPDHSYVWLTRGDQYARLGLWDLAAADFQRAFQLKEPASTRALCLHAILCFYVGDAKGYRRVCERMKARLSEASDARACDEISRACLLDKDPIIDPEQLVQLALRAVEWEQDFHTPGEPRNRLLPGRSIRKRPGTTPRGPIGEFSLRNDMDRLRHRDGSSSPRPA